MTFMGHLDRCAILLSYLSRIYTVIFNDFTDDMVVCSVCVCVSACVCKRGYDCQMTMPFLVTDKIP